MGAGGLRFSHLEVGHDHYRLKSNLPVYLFENYPNMIFREITPITHSGYGRIKASMVADDTRGRWTTFEIHGLDGIMVRYPSLLGQADHAQK